MGKSAKFHKRVPNKLKSSTSIAINSTNPSAKKRSTFKQKTASSKSGGNGPVLGGADYVSLLMGSRKKVREEAKKLPQDDS